MSGWNPDRDSDLDPGWNVDWMSRLPPRLHDVPLWELAIPGSHDSMSFCLDASSPLLPSQPCILTLCDRVLPRCTRTCVFRWATTQQQSVLSQQCDLGVRFLDLRVAKKPKAGGDLYFAHGLYTKLRVKETLQELSCWLDLHPSEVFIIAFSHFESLTDEDHTHLMNLITSLFTHKLVYSKEIPTLRSCWVRGQQLVVSYDREQEQHPELWPGIPYWYADSPDPLEVVSYLEERQREGRPAGFYVCGLNLTEDAACVLLHPLDDLRKMTVKAAAPLLRWAAAQRAGPGAAAVNIICCDFVGLIADFCSRVIALNYKPLLAVTMATLLHTQGALKIS
ncbi:PI-PLC X domain-containing protein 1-like isoform X1 [Salarias fasciatus]|uniref:PI-PLC X domain-containing protein 1-like isoform X1 n=1 Tax=Salarias fasciatus TaxID=181472 RepID=UPI001176C942|nr:PI-PLC X domain-containing protein 1-like isoform X1 [Salarias fasciatus]